MGSVLPCHGIDSKSRASGGSVSAFFRKLSWLGHRRQREEDLREELQFHLDEEAEQLRLEGMSANEAAGTARRDLGNVLLLREDARAAWGWVVLEQFIQDVRYGLRTMASNRLFTLLAVVSLAMGIGANTAIYSFMDALLLRALPVVDPKFLGVLNWHSKTFFTDGKEPFVMHRMSGSYYDDGKSGVVSPIFPYPAFELIESKGTMFSSVFAFRPAERLTL